MKCRLTNFNLLIYKLILYLLYTTTFNMKLNIMSIYSPLGQYIIHHLVRFHPPLDLKSLTFLKDCLPFIENIFQSKTIAFETF